MRAASRSPVTVHVNSTTRVPRGTLVARGGLLLALLLPLASERAHARVLLSQKDALAIAFPGRTPERKTAYLTDEQVAAAQKQARAKLDSKVWSYYVAASTGGAKTYAYFDSHVVRTMKETVMVVVGEGGEVLAVEILSFAEPDDYLPRRRWLDQLIDRKLDEELYVRRAVRNQTGATLTSQALTDGVRRVLAVHELVREKGKIGK